MEDTPCYKEGIEDSIRRCEELLAFTPLALETPASTFRRGYTTKNSHADSKKVAADSPGEGTAYSAENLWKMNMDLLSSGHNKSYDKFRFDEKCDHDGDQCTSSEQQGARIIENPGCQVQEGYKPLEASVREESTINNTHVVIPVEIDAERTTPSSNLTESKENFGHSETEISEFLCESETICCEEACSAEGSGNSDTVVNAKWFISDISPSPKSEPKRNAVHSARSEEKIHTNHFSRQKINEKKRSKSVSKDLNRERRLVKSERSKSVLKEPFMERLQTLARPRTEVYKKLAELKAILEREKLQQCSFKPCVGRKPDPESMHSAPIFERIMEMQQRMELRKRARKAYEKEELDNCSFWPQINWRSHVFDKITYQPIQERFQALQRQKFEKIINAQLRKDISLTFKPEINQKSIQLCKQKGLESINVSDRLNSSQNSVHQDCKLEPQRNKGTFVPEINKNTDYIIASSKHFGGSVGFLERQKYYMETAEEKKRSKQHGTPIDLTFRPDIGNSAMILKQSHGQDMLDETPLERFERLAYKDKEQLFYTRQKAAESYYAQFHFHPEIDEFSRVLAQSNSVHDLYKNEKGKKVKEALEQAAKNEFQQKCPFRPELNPISQRNEYALQRRKQRKEKTNCEQESRTLKELEEMKECTFKPVVNPSPLKETVPAKIKGLERHLALQSIAKQMKKEHEELERKVFFVHSHAFPIRQYTIPRPFMLHTAQGRYGSRRAG